jgi:hypothetical protein
MLEVNPSPNDQFHVVGSVMERSVKTTLSGVLPDRGVAEKSATGGIPVENTVMVVNGVVEFEPWLFATVSRAE